MLRHCSNVVPPVNPANSAIAPAYPYNNADLQLVVYVKLQADFLLAACRIRQMQNLVVVYAKLQLNFELATCRIRQVARCCKSTCLSAHRCRCSTSLDLYSYFSPTSSPLHPYFCATYHPLHPPISMRGLRSVPTSNQINTYVGAG